MSDFIPKAYQNKPKSGIITCQSPSNIALIKYWGKKEIQIPQNPSVSFTLSKCFTETHLEFSELKENAKEKYSFDLFFESEKKERFRPKIETFFERIDAYLPFLKNTHFTIKTSNSFPHSSGIASSASSMSAIAFGLIEIEKQLNPKMNQDFARQKASFLARLGSGSACRSLYQNLVSWGEHRLIKKSSNLFGTEIEPSNIHPIFNDYQDTILLIDKGEKMVSSSAGHNIMNQHTYKSQRFGQASQNLEILLNAISKGDLKTFIGIVESEALTLHGLMMTSQPYFILMRPQTLSVIEKIWHYRKTQNSALCFTLDAGANVHLLYPKNEKSTVLKFIDDKLSLYCQDGTYICDEVGRGTKLI